MLSTLQMSDDPKNTQPQDPEGGDQGGNGGDDPKQGDPKTFTQDQIDSIISDRLKKQEEKLAKQHKADLEKAQKEAERQAQLSADEREKERRQQEAAELEERELKITLRENAAEGKNLLTDNGLPTEFIDFINDSDMEVVQTRIKSIKKVWDAKLEEAVKEATKGKTPTAPEPGKTNAGGLPTAI